MLFSWKGCSAPGFGAAILGSGAAGHPPAPNRVLDPLTYRFSQITLLAANRTLLAAHVKLLISIFAGLRCKCRFRSRRRSGTNPSIQEESSNTDGDVLVMAISLSGTSTTRSKTSSEWQSFPNEHICLLGIENTHEHPLVLDSCFSAPGISFLSALTSVGNVMFFFLFLAYPSWEAPGSGLGTLCLESLIMHWGGEG